MTLKKIYRSRPDIKEKVEALYPKPKKECKLERAKREWKIWQRAKMMYEETQTGKVEYVDPILPTKQEHVRYETK
jgi:hypothetical protein